MFRQSSPWPYQTLGARRTADGEYVVIVSEPPPVVTSPELTELLRAIFGPSLLEVTRLRFPTGIDGWLEDVVLRVRVDEREAPLQVLSGHDLRRWSIPASLVQRLQWLHRTLQMSAEGFYVDDLAAWASAARPAIPSVQITANDVSSWLGATREWTVLGRMPGKKLKWSEIEQSTAPRALHAAGGLVALAIPAGTSSAQLAPALRLYGIASDLTVAAVRPKRRTLMVLLGRTRQLPLTILPPLRLESFSRVAQAAGLEMGQSYERGRIFAGRVDAGPLRGWDWAPIYLSKPLEDSEFGTLLNLADQVLKSWSERGRVEYFGFDYARPDSYPFEKQRASEYFTSKLRTRSLTFNWNTNGYTTLVDAPVGLVITADRSGALPITYLPGDGPPGQRVEPSTVVVARDGADTARAYFDRLGDPLLVRVAQHVLLFHALGSMHKATTAGSKAEHEGGRTDVVHQALKLQAQNWLASPGLTQSLPPDVAADLMALRRRVGMNDAHVADLLTNPHSRQASQREERLQRELIELRVGSRSLVELAERKSTLFKRMCTDLRGSIVPVVEPGRTGERCNFVEPAVKPPSMKAYMDSKQQYDDLNGALQRQFADFEARVHTFRQYAENLEQARQLAVRVGGRAGDTWAESRVLAAVLERAAAVHAAGSIRTPSVVLSYDAANVFTVGGHNIGAGPLRVQLDAAAARPSVRRVGDGNVLTMSPQHLRVSGDIVRRGLEAADSAPTVPLQPMPAALKLAPGGGNGNLPPTPPGLTAFADLPPAGRRLSQADLMARFADEACTVCVLRDGHAGHYVFEKGPPTAVHFVIDATQVPEVISTARNHKVTAFYGEESVESSIWMASSVRVADAQSLAREGFVRRSIEGAKALFSGVRSSDGLTVSVLLRDARGAAQQFVLLGGRARPTSTLMTRVSTKGAHVNDLRGQGAAWLKELGALGERFGPSPVVTEVRFPALGAAPRVEVRMVTNATVAPSVQADAARHGIAKSAEQAELAAVLGLIRSEVKARTNATELLFQIDAIGGDLRVARADLGSVELR